MSESNERDLRAEAARHSGWTRRGLLRRAGLVGVGAVTAGLAGCKQRPEQELADLSTEPNLIQQGGTISGQIRGLLTGATAAFCSLKIAGFPQVRADAQGRFSVRIDKAGEYPVQVSSDGFVRRTSHLLVDGSSTLDVRLLESDAGLPMPFLNEYARGTGSTREGVVPRTPGATNRWLGAPRVVLYRGLEDSDKDVVPEARIADMQASIQALFGPLTGNVLGGTPGMEVRQGTPPPSLAGVDSGDIVVAQREGGGVSSEHAGSAADRYSIVKARISCRYDSPIALFNRMFAHALGGWVVSEAAESVLNPDGREEPSDRDLRAATFLYNRAPGNMAPDEDPSGVLLNG